MGRKPCHVKVDVWSAGETCDRQKRCTLVTDAVMCSPLFLHASETYAVGCHACFSFLSRLLTCAGPAWNCCWLISYQWCCCVESCHASCDDSNSRTMPLYIVFVGYQQVEQQLWPSALLLLRPVGVRTLLHLSSRWIRADVEVPRREWQRPSVKIRQARRLFGYVCLIWQGWNLRWLV